MPSATITFEDGRTMSVRVMDIQWGAGTFAPRGFNHAMVGRTENTVTVELRGLVVADGERLLDAVAASYGMTRVESNPEYQRLFEAAAAQPVAKPAPAKTKPVSTPKPKSAFDRLLDDDIITEESA